MLHQELRANYVKTTSFVKADSTALLTKVVDELRVEDESDGHVVASQVNCTAPDAVKDFILVGLDPYLGQTVASL